METLGAFLDACAARDPKREALACAPREKVTARISWHELREQSRDAARRLVAAGVGKGTRVGFLCPNRAEWLPITFGALRIGAILVPFSTLWKRDEIAYALNHADVQLLVTLPGFLKHDYLARLREIIPELDGANTPPLRSAAAPALRRIVVLGDGGTGFERWRDLESDVDDEVLDALERAVSPADLATIFFTSGTTAQAKAVLHGHAALATAGRRVAECLGIGRDDAWWGHLPLFWSGGFVLGALAAMAGGGRIVLQETVDAGSALELLEDERCTIMAGWHQAGPLLDHPDFAKHMIHLRKGTYHELAPRLLGPRHQAIGVYGMSETATFVSAARSTDSETVRCETFGRPLDGVEIRIIDSESRRPLPRGETGEILVKSPTMMEGYYKVPRAATFDAEGFFRTGDRGYFDEQGCLHFGGRLKDVIKTAGVNVAAAEVEEALARHPSVKSAYVVGVPDPVRGENVAAFVVLGSGAAADAEAIRAFCREGLASYKVPRHVFFIAPEEVPRTGTGKIEKTALRDAAIARIGAD